MSKKFNPLSLLKNSVHKDPIRPVICAILVESDGVTVATNGQLLSCVPSGVPELPKAGLYNPRTLEPLIDPPRYPNWMLVVPKAFNYGDVQINITARLSKAESNTNKLILENGEIRRDDSGDIVGSYEGDFCGAFFERNFEIIRANKKSFTLEFSGGDTPARIKHENGAYSIVMPVR